MRQEQRFKAISKVMSWALRHEADRLQLIIDPEGYVPLTELTVAINAHASLNATEAEIRQLVQAGDAGKQRFSIVGDWIRANYGHTLVAEVRHPVVVPPATLYHGTSSDKVDDILVTGLKPMLRQFVHLTTEHALARSVGARHGRPIVLRVDAVKAHASGVSFFKANERFWLSRLIPPDFVHSPGALEG
jgi:putative RNA 2'-phosphotransferase